MDTQKVTVLLWEKIDALSVERSLLKKKSEELFEICSQVRARELHGLELVRLEGRYWEIDRRLRAIDVEENEILVTIEAVERGDIPPEFLETPQEENKLSKRRQAIEREKAKIPKEDPDLFWQNYLQRNFPCFPSPSATLGVQQKKVNGRFLTTGRRATHVKGRISPLDVEGAFFDATADTHGGKVRGGSKPAKGTYVNAAGKRIRKR